jgi:hypothetical protein
MICSLTSIAKNVGVPRVLAGRSIPTPTGDAALGPEEETAMRKKMALEALKHLDFNACCGV